jgi:uncharacterized oxidoreductase
MLASQLERLATEVLRGAGAPPDEAHIVGRHLVEANLAGHDSHGVLRIPQYLAAMQQRRIRPGCRLTVVREAAAGLLADGQLGFGQVIARDAMTLAVGRARTAAVCAVSVFRSNHVGRLANHTLLAAEQGMIGILMVNAGGAGQLVAPFGGLTARLATNPISIAVPGASGPPLVLDIATSVAPEGKLRAYRQRGAAVPDGWIIDAAGRPTTAPADFYGPPPGALLPLGGPAGHKGYGLALMIDILAGGLSGAGCSRPDATPEGDGLFLLAIDVRQFGPFDEFQQRVAELVQHVKSSPPAPGFTAVQVPGESEQRETERRLRDGIDIDERTWSELEQIAREFGIPVP